MQVFSMYLQLFVPIVYYLYNLFGIIRKHIFFATETSH